MRFLVDAQLPPALADWLKSNGHQAEHVFERLGANRPDAFIAQMSMATECVVVSKDVDFLALQIDGKPQFLWGKLGNSTNRRLLECFAAEWPNVIDALSRGDSVVEIG